MSRPSTVTTGTASSAVAGRAARIGVVRRRQPPMTSSSPRQERGEGQERDEARTRPVERDPVRARGPAARRASRSSPCRDPRSRRARDASCPAGTAVSTVDPASTTAPAPMRDVGTDRAAGADVGVGADVHPADVDDVAVHPVARQVDLGLDAGAVADRQHPGDGRHGVQVDAAADRRAERAGVVDDPRRAGQADGAHGLGEAFGGPQPQLHAAAARVGAGLEAGEQEAGGRRRRGAIRPSGVTKATQPTATHPPRHGTAQGARSRARSSSVTAIRATSHWSALTVSRTSEMSGLDELRRAAGSGAPRARARRRSPAAWSRGGRPAPRAAGARRRRRR